MTTDTTSAGAPTAGAATDQASRDLLGAHPRARLMAVDDLGMFVAMPSSVPVTAGQRLISGHSSALDLVVADDLVAVIDAWRHAHEFGRSQADVRPVAAPGSTMTLHFLDVRATHGVFLAVAVGEGAELIAEASDEGSALRPRLIIARQDALGVFVDVSEEVTSILGHLTLVGVSSVDLIHPEDAPRAVGVWMDMLGTPGCSRRMRLRQRHLDGHWVWFEVTLRNLLEDPTVGSVVSEMIDITDQMAAHEHLVAQETLLRRLTDSLPVGVAQLDAQGRVVHRNPHIDALLGRPDALRIEDLLLGVADDDRERLGEAVRAAREEQDSELEVTVGHGSDARRCQVLLRSLPDRSEGVSGFILCVSDVTEPARLRDRLRHQATFDALTGCHNRASVLAELDGALDPKRGADLGAGVLFLDLDGFKEVNDRLGHDAGDALLRDVAECLRDTVRADDVVGRIGGDEFVVLQPGARSGEQTRTLAERVCSALAATFSSGPDDTAVASIGVAWTGGPHADDAATLVSRADQAMYRSKARGDGQPVVG